MRPAPKYNESLRELVPRLVGPAAAKGTTPLRDCYVVDGVVSTYVIPGDWLDDIKKWGQAKTHFAPSPNNQARYYCRTGGTQVGGAATFEAMKDAFDTATGQGHFIVLLGWSLDLDFPLDGDTNNPKGIGNTMREIFTQKIASGVMVRTLLWRPGGDAGSIASRVVDDQLASNLPAVEYKTQNGFETAFIETRQGPVKPIAVWDASMRDHTGSHHQKILVVYGTEGLIAFFGGVDLSRSRVEVTDDAGTPIQDVHCRVQGDAAHHLLELCIARWNASREARPQEDATTWLSLVKAPGTLPPPGPGAPRQEVQIGHTVGNPAMPFPSDGWGMLQHCIQTAKKFIYMEDQYFWSEDVGRELNKALPKLEHLTLVLADSSISDSGSANVIMRRRATSALLKGLAPADKKKIAIYAPSKAGSYGTYVHSKLWIFDDECAIIASSNCNNRGYFNDSEMMGRLSEAAIRTFDDLDLNFAHKLRMALWYQHLDQGASMESLYDPSSAFYFRLAPWGLGVAIESDGWGLWDDFSTYNEEKTFKDWKTETIKNRVIRHIEGVETANDLVRVWDPRA